MISLTAAATKKVKEIQEAEGLGEQGLRVRVIGGGCSGFSYDLFFDDETNEQIDERFESEGIPIFIDTDCLLPFEDKIPYRELFPWVRQDELPRAAEILMDFHRRLSNEDFIALQHACRKLWEQHFTSAGFHSDFCEKIDELR